jgi:hypothetical protein
MSREMLDLVRAYLQAFPETQLATTELRLGTYRGERHFPPYLPTEVDLDPRRPSGFKLPFHFRLHVFSPALRLDRKAKGIVLEPWRKERDAFDLHIYSLLRIVDLATDDEPTMRWAGFPFAAQVAALSQSTRKVYAQDLDRLDVPPPGLPKDVTPAAFVRALAQFGTYDETGRYFTKWRDPEVRRAPLEQHATERYLRRVVRERELVQGATYALWTTPLGATLFELTVENGRLRRDVVSAGYDVFYPPGVTAAEEALPSELVFFHAEHGRGRVTFDADRDRFDARSITGHRTTLVDPEHAVTRLLGPEAARRLSHVGDPWGWFVEWVEMFHPSAFCLLDIAALEKRHHVQVWPRLIATLREHLTTAVMTAAAEHPEDEYGGRLDPLDRARLALALSDRRFLVLPQGLGLGRQARFVGGNEGVMYQRDLVSGAVWATPTPEFLESMFLRAMGKEITMGSAVNLMAIPLASSGVMLALMAPGGAIALLVNRLRTEAGELAARQLTKYLAPAFAGLVASLATRLFIAADDDDAPESLPRRWRSFADGFLRGYVWNTLYDHLWRTGVVETLTEGPAEYRMYKSIRTAYEVVDRVRVTLAQIETMDAETVRVGIAAFRRAALHMLRGSSLLVGALYWVTYEHAKPILELFGMGPDGRAPDEAEWEIESAQQIAELIRILADELDVAELREFLGRLRDDKVVMAAASVFVLKSEAWSLVQYTWRKHPWAAKRLAGRVGESLTKTAPRKAGVVVAILATIVGASYALDELTDGVSTDLLEWIGRELWESLPGPTETRAEVHGKIYGSLFGGLLLNRFLYKAVSAEERAKGRDKKSAEQKMREWLEDHPMQQGMFRANLKFGVVGALLSLILQRYVSFREEVVKDGWLKAVDAGARYAAINHAIRSYDLQQRKLEHLEQFLSRDETETQGTFADLIVAFLAFRDVIDADFAEFFAKEHAMNRDSPVWNDDLRSLVRFIEATGLTTKITPETRRRLFAVFLTHLQLAVREISLVVEAVMERWQPKEESSFSWGVVLSALGIDLGNLSEVDKRIKKARDAELKSRMGHR